MRWLTVIFLANAAACLTLAVIHTHVWFRQRQASARLGFAMLAASVAGMAWCELRMALSTSPAEYGRWLWWYQLPVWTGTVSLVAFVHLYLGAGRRWLGALAVGLRTLAMAINLVSTPAIQFREITTLVDVTLLGDTVAAAVGPANPLLVVGHVSLLVLIAFVVDATWDLWRRAERRRALTIGGSLIVFVTTGMLTVAATTWAGARLPFVASLFFAPIVLAMAIELGRDLIRAVRLAEALDEASTELRTTDDRLALAADAAQAGLWSVDRATGRLWATPGRMACSAWTRSVPITPRMSCRRSTPTTASACATSRALRRRGARPSPSSTASCTRRGNVGTRPSGGSGRAGRKATR